MRRPVSLGAHAPLIDATATARGTKDGPNGTGRPGGGAIGPDPTASVIWADYSDLDDTMTALRRIQKELIDITTKPLPGVTVTPADDNLFTWRCSIKADPSSPYAGGTFHFKPVLPENYPFKAPSVTFTTKIYHPGINEEGNICVSILRDEWKPSITLPTVLSIIQEKVNNPRPEDPYEPEIAAMLKDDRPTFLAIAHEWTKKHAS